LVAAAKCLVGATKNLFVVPNFVAVAKPFLSVYRELRSKLKKLLTPSRLNEHQFLFEFVLG